MSKRPITLTRKIAKQVTKLRYPNDHAVLHTIYNDKLASSLNGNLRSLKVIGWNENDYQLARSLLEDQGCQVTVVQYSLAEYSRERAHTHSQMRLHVTEFV